MAMMNEQKLGQQTRRMATGLAFTKMATYGWNVSQTRGGWWDIPESTALAKTSEHICPDTNVTPRRQPPQKWRRSRYVRVTDLVNDLRKYVHPTCCPVECEQRDTQTRDYDTRHKTVLERTRTQCVAGARTKKTRIWRVTVASITCDTAIRCKNMPIDGHVYRKQYFGNKDRVRPIYNRNCRKTRKIRRWKRAPWTYESYKGTIKQQYNYYYDEANVTPVPVLNSRHPEKSSCMPGTTRVLLG